MSKYEIPFLTACIHAFGRRFSMTRQTAFRYLQEYKGLAFLIEFYDVEHLQSMDETIDDLRISPNDMFRARCYQTHAPRS